MRCAMKLAVFTKNLNNPAYAAARLGADRVAASFGAQVRHFVPTTPDDAAQQTALVHEALRWSPDALVFAAVHPTRVQDAVAAVRAAGVPIFAFVSRMDPGQALSFVGASDTRLARDIALYLFEHLRGRARLAIVEGPADSVTSRERVAAFDAAVRDAPGVRLVARCTGAYQREPAREAFADVLARHADVDAVLVANDIMALWVLDALQAAGRRAAVVGVNAIPQAITAIREGRMLATADFNAMQMCALATECALRHGRGEAVPSDVELPVGIVDASNAAQWDLPYEERALLTLAACTA